MAVKITQPARNLREELNELRTPTGIAAEAMMRADTPQEQFNLIGAGRKNLIINGAMQVSQRGSYSSATSLSTATYTLDRWKSSIGVVTATIQHTDFDNNMKGAKVASTSTGTGYMEYYQVLENPSFLDGRTVTLSARVKSNNPKCKLYCSGTNGIEGISENHSGNGQEEKMTLTFKVSTGNTVLRFYCGIMSDVGSNTPITSGDYLEFTEFQLELGKVATPFEHRSYGEELALCQRYYEVVLDSASYPNTFSLMKGSSTTQAVGVYKFTVTKRAAPTITVTGLPVVYVGGTGYAPDSVSLLDCGTQGGRFFTNDVGVYAASQAYHVDRSTMTLVADAEL